MSEKTPNQDKSHLKLVKTPAHHSAETTREEAEDLEALHGTRETPPFETEQTEETLEHHHRKTAEK